MTNSSITPLSKWTAASLDNWVQLTVAANFEFSQLPIFQDVRHPLLTYLILKCCSDESDQDADIKLLLSITGRTKASATTRVDRMVKAGLLERRHGVTDRRRIFLNLTPAGHEMIEVADEAMMNLINQV